MKYLSIVTILFAISINVLSQVPDPIRKMFPTETTFHHNIPYANDTLKKHLLDIYLPANAKGKSPLVVWIHGGAWNHNDKYADMGYMKNTVRAFIEKGYALASLDYRFSSTAIFPAQIKDCNQALQFLATHADDYNIDEDRIAVIGFSAGGHLAALAALSNNNYVAEFHASKEKPSFHIRAAVDFYGPCDFLTMLSGRDAEKTDDPVSMLLGSSPLKRPDISRFASPCTYVDKQDPPFFIVHGEKDESVPVNQSILLKSYLDIAGVKNEITIVKGAPHYGEMFDSEEVRVKLFRFLQTYL
jgi:acetyl esterase/lipase